MRAALLCVALPALALAACPYAGMGGKAPHPLPASYSAPRLVAGHDMEAYVRAVQDVDWSALKADLYALFTDSQDWWPADDFGLGPNYGPFFVRQAWHCSGSYRAFDGHGGCEGGRQRFNPELSWADNTNLEKAKKLLWPIKQKYGVGLSWGDLMIYTGTVAIEFMGGPVLGFCAGRVDDADGSASDLLGPTPDQEADEPCAVNGQCKTPFGSTTIGLIYLNPEGPMGNPWPNASALEIADTFGRMSMNDSETVALIGGGHAFGKTHGACPAGPGPSPIEQPSNSWPGMCGTGKGNDTYTSGFEGPWSSHPTQWGNFYYQILVAGNSTWAPALGPGGKYQWSSPASPGTMMLTSDIGLLRDPRGIYPPLVQMFSENLTELNNAFSHAWYKLVTRDMGPVTRCIGPLVPPPQPFQYPLPSPPASLPNFTMVAAAIQSLISSNESSILAPDSANGAPYYGAIFAHLAFQCASTFRSSDYQGGCNGARIQFAPYINWPANAGLAQALQLLQGIKNQFGATLSWSDLIVLAGTVAVSQATGTSAPFCGGRTDATEGSGWSALSPNTNYSASIYDVQLAGALQGLTPTETVVLSARLRSPSLIQLGGFASGSWATDPSVLSNAYFTALEGEYWTAVPVPNSPEVVQYTNGKGLYMTPSDMAVMWDDSMNAVVQMYAQDNAQFLSDFVAAWTKVMNADRFDGPASNVCSSEAANIMISA